MSGINFLPVLLIYLNFPCRVLYNNTTKLVHCIFSEIFWVVPCKICATFHCCNFMDRCLLAIQLFFFKNIKNKIQIFKWFKLSFHIMKVENKINYNQHSQYSSSNTATLSTQTHNQSFYAVVKLDCTMH